MMCRHCGVKRAIRPRGLCWADYYRPEIRALYPPGSANPATAKFLGAARLNADPCPAGETMADLDRIEAEQRACLPSWWWAETCQARPDYGTRPPSRSGPGAGGSG